MLALFIFVSLHPDKCALNTKIMGLSSFIQFVHDLIILASFDVAYWLDWII